MEFNNQEELYKALRPVFNVKKRLMSISKNQDIKNEDIWKYLVINKWQYGEGLMLSDLINDIINIEPKLVKEFIGEGDKYEKR